MKKENILRFLSGTARTSQEVLVFLIGGSLGSKWGVGQGLRAVEQFRKERARKDPEGERMRIEDQRNRQLIQMLKRDELIASSRSGRSATYSITKKGERWLDERLNGELREMPRGVYTKDSYDRVTIFTYDIPHHKRKMRDWLRGELIGIGLRMLQKSVFIGKVKIPEEMIKDLIRLELIDHVEIFEVTKRGTLRSAK